MAATVAVAPSAPSAARSSAARGSAIRAAIDVRAYGVAVGNVGVEQARANAQAIEKALLDAAAAGPGTAVALPPGLVLVHLDTADFSSNVRTSRISAIRCPVSTATLEGAGVGKTVLRAFHDGQDGHAYGILQFGVLPVDNGNSDNAGLVIRRMTLDGAHHDARPENWRPGLMTSQSTIIAEGLKDCVFSDLEILHSGGYAIGLQNGGYINNRLERIVIRHAMADGVDVKDNGAISSGNVLAGIRVERFGLATNETFPFAGIDLMGREWRIEDVSISHWGRQGSPAAGLRFKQGSDTNARGNGAVKSLARNIRIAGMAGEGPVKTIGVHVKCEDVTLENLAVSGVDFGAVVSQPRARIARFQIEARLAGVVQRPRESPEQIFPGGDDISVTTGTITMMGQGACGLDFQRPGARVSSVRFDVPKGQAVLARADVALSAQNLSYAASTQPYTALH